MCQLLVHPYRYKVLHNVTFPMGSAIGDHVGILGIRHLDRYLHNHTYTDDLTIADRIWHTYILGWSIRLDDGTVARKVGSCGSSMPTWPPADHAKYLWGESTRAQMLHSRFELDLRLYFQLIQLTFMVGDDLFMGLTLATRMVRARSQMDLINKKNWC